MSTPRPTRQASRQRPGLSFTPDGPQTIGPLATGSDFRVLEGACQVSTAAITPSNRGFLKRAGGEFFVAKDKTVYLQAIGGACTIHYEALA